MSMWKGVGQDIDAVFQWKDGNSVYYYYKGNFYTQKWKQSTEICFQFIGPLL